MTKILSTNDLKIFTKREEALKGDGFARLSLWHGAKKFLPSSEVSLRLATVYYDLKLYNQSIDAWFDFLSSTNSKEDEEVAYYGLANCFFEKGDVTIATFYLNKLFSEYGPLDASLLTEELVKHINDDGKPTRDDYKLVWPPEKVDYTDLITDVRGLSLGGETKKAIALAKSVPEGSPFYTDAQVELAFAEYCDENKNYSITLLEKALEKSPDSVNVLCTLASEHFYMRDNQKATEYIERAVEIAFKDGNYNVDLFYSACVLGRHDLIISLANEYLKDEPYSLTHLFFKGIALYNQGDLKSAKDCFYKCVLISPEDPVYNYYNKLVASDLDAGLNGIEHFIKIGVNLPEFEREEQKNTVAGLVKITIDKLEKALKDDEVIFAVKWGALYGDAETRKMSVCIMAGAKNAWCLKMLEKMLLSCEVSDVLKQLILTAMVTSGFGRKISVVTGNIFNTIKIAKVDDNASDKILFSYAGCVNALVAIGIKNTKKYAISAKYLDVVLGKNIDNFSPLELSALIMLYANDGKYSDPDFVAKVFLIRKPKFICLKNKAKELIDKNEKEDN